jgi:NADH-quinone oxidoreductase subunit A
LNPYVVFLMYLMAILGFVGLTLLLNRLLGPQPVSSATKLEPYECGATPVIKLNVKAVQI